MKTLAFGLAMAMGIGCLLPLAPAAADEPTGTDAIAERQDLMKSVGRATKAAGDMVKGAQPWDQAKAEEAMQTLIEAGTRFPSLFPEDSKTGHDTEAKAAIWDNFAEFEQISASLAEDAEAAKAAAANGLEAFQPAFGAAARNCRTCHEDFRESN